MKNPLQFLKKKKEKTEEISSTSEGSGNIADTLAGMSGMPDESKMNFVQKMAWKKFQKMSPDKQREVMKKAMTPKNIAKNKDVIMGQLEEMKAAGMMSDDQYRLAKRKMGLQ